MTYYPSLWTQIDALESACKEAERWIEGWLKNDGNWPETPHIALYKIKEALALCEKCVFVDMNDERVNRR